MVELTKLLMSILETRKDELTGNDIKLIVEAIQVAEAIVKVEIDPKAKTPQQILKEWMGE